MKANKTVRWGKAPGHIKGGKFLMSLKMAVVITTTTKRVMRNSISQELDGSD